MDVVDPGPNFVRIVIFREGAQQFHLGTRGFDGDNVGICLAGPEFSSRVEVHGVSLGGNKFPANEARAAA